jgi:hypothetical protein
MAILSSSLCLASPDAFLSPSEAQRLDPGANLEARWSVDAPELEGKDEMELVLSLDGGATFPVRLTARILPGDRRVGWRVPALSTEHARIALRSGSDENGETESILLVSEGFSIASAGSAAAENLFAVGTELRTREALEGAPAQRASSSLCPGDPPPVFEATNVLEAGAEDGPAVTTTIALLASHHEVVPSLSSRPDAPAPATPRRTPVPLRL